MKDRVSMYMLLSEHYKLTIGDDKFVDYFTFPNEKRRKRVLQRLL